MIRSCLNYCAAFTQLLYRSFVEKDKLSPRLLTTFATVSLTGWLEVQVVMLALNGRPESPMLVQVILANLGLIGLLLGLGKVADTYRDVKASTALEAAVATQQAAAATPPPSTPDPNAE